MIAGELNVIGDLTAAPGAGAVANGMEASAVVLSRGQTLPDVRGLTANVATLGGSTTNIRDANVIVSQRVRGAGSGKIANAYVFEMQSVGTGRNYSIWVQGPSLFSSDTNLDALDSNDNPQHVLTFTKNDFVLFRPMNDQNGLVWYRDLCFFVSSAFAVEST